MKTTIEISDSILRKAKRLARDQGLTLRSLTEEGLSKVIKERSTRKSRAIEPIIVGGKGLTKEFQNKSWSEIRDAAYGVHCS